MEITLKIKDSLIKEILESIVDDLLYAQYSNAVLKKAGVPKKAELVRAILSNKHVESVIQKEYSDYVEPDILYDILYDAKFSEVDGLVISCEDIAKEEQKEKLDKQRAEEIKNAVRLVELAGFKIVKE